MKQLRFLMLAGGLLAVLLGSRSASAQSGPNAENYKVRVEAYTWDTGLEGQIQKGFGADSGTLLDLTDDLGVADERTYGGNVSIQIK